MRHAPLAIFAALVLSPAGCQTHQPTNEDLAEVYRLGLSPKQVEEQFSPDGLVRLSRSVQRPGSGWTDAQGLFFGKAVDRFERSSGNLVQQCDVYFVPRGFMGLGIWNDYVYFGEDLKLIGFQRFFLD